MEEASLSYAKLYISSSDTLCGKMIDQRMKIGWNDRPPIFLNRGDTDDLLKGMIRKGVPPALRCAVWMSNIIRACYPHQGSKYSEEFRTLGKVRFLDAGWDAIMREIYPDESDRRDAVCPHFGNTDYLDYFENVTKRGKLALAQVLNACEHILGLEYCPLMPTLAAIMLRYMSESYVLYALREMAQNSTWFLPITQVEQHAWSNAFAEVLTGLHPQTATTMREVGALTVEGLEPIFKYFFLPILPQQDIVRIMDIYTFEGSKVIFRFGVALLTLFRRDVKDLEVSSKDEFWQALRAYTMSSPYYRFEVLCKKAYGFHGQRVGELKRFPRRQMFARIIKMEEEKAVNSIDFELVERIPRALGLIDRQPVNGGGSNNGTDPPKIQLGRDAMYRSNLAKWLPMSLRLTKLDLIYTTNAHGRTLERFYSHVKNIKQTITLVECLDNGSIIGMFASQPWGVSNKVYGDGECFLFRLDPDPQCWKWKPHDVGKSLDEDLNDADGVTDPEELEITKSSSLVEQFMVGRETFISMGGNDSGTCGLRLNEDLTRGESAPANGFQNDPLPGRSNFEVGVVEVYRLVRAMDGKTAEQYNAEQFTRTM